MRTKLLNGDFSITVSVEEGKKILYVYCATGQFDMFTGKPYPDKSIRIDITDLDNEYWIPEIVKQFDEKLNQGS